MQTQSKILSRIQQEYVEGNNFLRNRKLRQVKQLVLFNNLRRGDQNIASSMLFTFFTRVLGGLYDDKINIKFIPSEDSDYKKTEALNKLAVNDYREMEKDILDYEWLWDTCFYGRGYVETLRFDKERKIMIPQVINPLVLNYDPNFAKVQDWRYYNKWVLKSNVEIERLIRMGVITGARYSKDITQGVDPELWDYKVRSEAAKEGNAPSQESLSENSLYQILEHFTYDDEGNKCVYWVDRSFSRVLRKEILDLRDGEDGESEWPLVEKELFREPHSSLPVSLPDIIEDKHRALNVLYNLSYLAAKDEANPIYEYDINKVKDVTQLFQRQVSQHIPVKEIGAIQPLKTTSALTQPLLQFIGLLKSESSDAIGTTYVMPGLKKGKDSATSAALAQQVADLTQSVQSKVLAIGERKFWKHWYQRYERYSKEGDKKIISISTVNGVTFENIELDEIKTKYPPKVSVNSSKEAEYKELVIRRDLQQILGDLADKLDPKGMANFLKHVFLPKYDIDTSTIDAMMPKSIDEIQAEQENELLNINELPKIKSTDDDEVHIYTHLQAKNTAAKWSHYFAHQFQLGEKKKQQMEQQAQQAQQQNGGNNQKKSPTDNQEGAVPLMQMMKNSAKTPKVKV